MSLKWTKEMSVGVEEIDSQHKSYFDIINNLYEVVHSSTDYNEISSILRQLKHYAEFHFATEEKYFDKFNYELSDDHKIEHRKFSAELEELSREFQVNKEKTAFSLVEFLEDWIAEHIRGYDSKYIGCFHKNGLK